MTRSPRAGYDLAESKTLALVQGVRGFQGRIVAWLLTRLRREGFEKLGEPQLIFLGALDCGDNHAAALARQLGVSRQAVHKMVRELAALGWLETGPDPALGNQKTIRFTAEGERMMSVARAAFAELDQRLEARLGAAALEDAQRLLDLEGFPEPDDAN